jgi:hypothetical protein
MAKRVDQVRMASTASNDGQRIGKRGATAEPLRLNGPEAREKLADASLQKGNLLWTERCREAAKLDRSGDPQTASATVLGTLTAIGLSDPKFPARRFVLPLLISPLIVPVVVTAVGTYLFYARVGLANTYFGIILAHTVLVSPFVVVTVGASLTGFDRNLMRATSILGAKPVTGFLRVMLPLIVRRRFCFCDVVRRSGRGAVSRQCRAEDPAARNVHGPARAIEPGDRGGRHLDDGPVDPVVDRRQPALARLRRLALGRAGSGQLTAQASSSRSIMPAHAMPFTPRLILRPSGNRFESETGASSVSRARLVIGLSICVVRSSITVAFLVDF